MQPTIPDTFCRQELESLPLGQLSDLLERRLAESKLLTRAATSELYQRRWQLAGISPNKITGIADLRRVPLTTESDLAEACRGKNINSSTCAAVQVWFQFTTKGGKAQWIPYGKEDITRSWELAMRMTRVIGLTDNDVMLVITSPAPALNNVLPYLLAYAHRLKGGPRVEIIPASLALLELKPRWADFFLRRPPTVLVAQPGDAISLARIMRQGAKIGEAKSVLEKLRLMLLYGDNLDRYRSEIGREYNAAAYQTQGIADFSLFNVECEAHQGIHFWLDACIPEIIPATELERGKADPGDNLPAVFLPEAAPGLKGELVITTFGQALPLIRYRTGEQIEFVSREPCQCGRTHPRIKLL